MTLIDVIISIGAMMVAVALFPVLIIMDWLERVQELIDNYKERNK